MKHLLLGSGYFLNALHCCMLCREIYQLPIPNSTLMKEPWPILLDVQRCTKLGSFIVGSLSRLSKCSFLFVDNHSFLLCLIAKELLAHEQCCLAALPCPANFIKTNVRSQDNMLKKKVLTLQEAATTGMPVVRHMFLHYPHDKHVQSIVYQQFLVGSDILVVPVLDKGCTKVHAYFPAGDVWKHVWTGILYSGAARAGQKAWVQAPLGFPAVFVKAGSQVATKFMANLVHQGVVNKKLSSTAPSQQ